MIKSYIQKATRRSIVVGRKRYFLSFPAIKFQITYGCRKRDEKLIFYSLRLSFICSRECYFPSLPNISADLYVCLKFHEYCENEDELIKKVVDNFWSSEFRNTYTKSWDKYKNYGFHGIYQKILSNLDKWQEKTLKNPKWKPKSKDMVSIFK